MKIEKKEIHRKQFKKVSLVFKLIIFAVILIGIPLYIWFYQPQLLEDFSSIKSIESWLMKYKTAGGFVYLGMQVIQIIICIIPGQALQFAVGYIYGFWIGIILSIVGAVLGSVIVYYIARFLGKDAVHIFFGERKVTEMIDNMNSRKGLVITFIIFLIPGIPKDICSYAAGLSDLKLKPYLIVSLIARIPGMAGSLLIGHQIHTEEYTSAIIIVVVAVVLFLLGMIYRKQVINFVDRVCDRLLDM